MKLRYSRQQQLAAGFAASVFALVIAVGINGSPLRVQASGAADCAAYQRTVASCDEKKTQCLQKAESVNHSCQDKADMKRAKCEQESAQKYDKCMQKAKNAEQQAACDGKKQGALLKCSTAYETTIPKCRQTADAKLEDCSMKGASCRSKAENGLNRKSSVPASACG